MIRTILIAFFAVSTIGAGVWGYMEHQDKNAVLIQAENNYQRAFHELTYNVELLHDKIGSTLAMNSRQQLSPQLAEIWKVTSEANGDVGQLPLTLMPFNKTEEFLSQIGDFAYRTAVRDLEKKPLTEEEVQKLEELHEHSREIKNELRKVQNVVLRDNLRWMDVELALATNDEVGDNTIVDGFRTVEKTVEGFETAELGTGSGTSDTTENYRFLSGENLSKEQAEKVASSWLEDIDTKKLRMTDSGKGAEVPTITASFQDGEKNGYLDMTKKGGHPLTMMISRPIKKAKIGLHEASEKAKSFVERLDVDSVELVESSQYGNTGVFRFVYTKDDIRYYPDAMVLKVALDNGEVMGLSAREFFNYHNDRKINPPVLTEEKAREKVNPQLEIQQQRLSVIENDIKEEVLCYEFLTTMENTTYRIFINATNGEEEKVETLKKSEMKYNQEV
ncbi:germination protein YpeB [Halobacillus salinus]|uniref:Germination protein YpeB n=1 Tax=Halobacillus salinus TaxID=192814 RepID=A0A4Z0H4X7_9BACI|nr:germination protein YpeB [Halobacillus salinus]TGB04511.1 germination protein YpeB [Halobacillus salinus]